MSYYERSNILHLDGTRVFATKEDREAEREVAALVEKAWNCELHQFGALSPIDWYAVRAGRMVGLLELKSRSHACGTYQTTWLVVRKWLALMLGSIAFGVPAIFVVKFTDRVMWIPLREINASRIVIGGCTRYVKAVSDINPMIEIPVEQLRELA